MLHRVPCIDKVREAIGWEPTRTLEDILADVVGSLAPRMRIAA
jgi:nucleoside-diphosphate-sugar epimerase